MTMKFYSILLLFLASFSCTAQKSESLKEVFIAEFIKHNKELNTDFKEQKLFILGYGNSFSAYDIEVKYLSLAEVKKKVQSDGEFYILSMEDIFIDKEAFKTSFKFLLAKKDYPTDFTVSPDNEGEFYCLKYNCDTEGFSVFWCDNNN
tara:strand:- start:196747 stop:197190 length:444 start_codon:yes stop_codon:yes gene_type:complete